MIEVGRRGFLSGLMALVAAPAIVRVASLMPCTPTEVIQYGGNNLLTMDMITRESVRLFTDNNAFLRSLDEQYENEFAADGAKIGTHLRIRLPNDYTVSDGPSFSFQDPTDRMVYLKSRRTLVPASTLPKLSAPEVIAIGTAAVLAKNPSISRRFWGA